MAFGINNCCFCVELRTGSLLLGYFKLGWTAAEVYMGCKEALGEVRTAGTVAMTVLGLSLLLEVLNLIFLIVLLVGLHKYKRGHLKAYLIYAGIYIVFTCIMFILTIAQSPGVRVRDIFNLDLFNLLLSIYFLVVIRSYYLKMNDAAAKPAVYDTA